MFTLFYPSFYKFRLNTLLTVDIFLYEAFISNTVLFFFFTSLSAFSFSSKKKTDNFL